MTGSKYGEDAYLTEHSEKLAQALIPGAGAATALCLILASLIFVV